MASMGVKFNQKLSFVKLKEKFPGKSDESIAKL